MSDSTLSSRRWVWGRGPVQEGPLLSRRAALGAVALLLTACGSRSELSIPGAAGTAAAPVCGDGPPHLLRLGKGVAPSVIRADSTGAFMVASSFSGTIVVDGKEVSNIGNTDTALVQYDSAGEVIQGWFFGSQDQTKADPTQVRDEPSALAAYESGGFVAALTSKISSAATTTVVAFDPTGSVKWQQSLLRTRADALATLGDDVTYITGLSNPTPAQSFRFFARLDEGGNEVWRREIRGVSGFSSPTGFAIDPAGRLVFAGSQSGAVEFEPGKPIVTPDFDVFHVVLNAVDGSTTSVVSYPATGGQYQGRGLALGPDSVTLGGYMDAPVDFGGGLLTTQGRAGFLASFDSAHSHRWSMRTSRPVADVRRDEQGRTFALNTGAEPYGTAELLALDDAGGQTVSKTFGPVRVISFDVGDCVYVAGRARGNAKLGGVAVRLDMQGEGFVLIDK